jgi:hypothetical protein
MGPLDLLYLVIFSIVTGAVGSWLANELTSVSDPVARWLVKKAAAKLPNEDRSRYEAEWLQVIIDHKSPTVKLLHAAHLRFRAPQIALDIRGIGISPWTFAGVRALDFGVAATSLLLLAPLLVAVSLTTVLDIGGPALVFQPRIGRAGKEFRLLKFRTGGSLLGRVVRRGSFDELPALFNVLIGDMSFIGPRAPLPGEKPSSLLSTFRPGLPSSGDEENLPVDWNSVYGLRYWLKSGLQSLKRFFFGV